MLGAPDMLSFADSREFVSPEDRFQRCAFCGRPLVVLPDDRRGGACFDCLSILGDSSASCPDCGAESDGDLRLSGCPRCGSFGR